MTKQVQRRRGTATQHTSFTGAEGELSVNTTNKSVHVHDNVTAGGFEAARADMDNVTSSSILTAAGITATTAELNYVDGVTSNIQAQLDGKAGTASPTFTGTLTTANLTATGTTTLAGASTSADITFGDNDKAIFGAGSDLQIYHDGSASYIDDAGTGALYIRGNAIVLEKYTGERLLDGTGDAAVKLYYDNAVKLATTSTGIDVTGTVTADGLTVDGLLEIDGSANGNVASIALTRTDASWSLDNETNFRIYGNTGDTTNPATKRMEIATNGDISFYEDTGTTPKFFWDADVERLGIGTSSPSDKLHVQSSGDTKLKVETTGTTAASGHSGLSLNTGNGGYLLQNLTTSDSTHGVLRIYDTANSAERLRIDSSGNVGIGTNTPSSYTANGNNLVVADVNVGITLASTSASGSGALYFADGTTGSEAYRGIINYLHASDAMGFHTGAAERMRIDSSGNVGIGNTSSGYLFTSGETRLAVGDGSEHAAIQIYSGTTKWGGLEFADDATNGTGQGFIGYYHPSDYMQFNTSGSEAMRIDSSGNLLVGKTASNSIADDGIQLSESGQLISTNSLATANSGQVAIFNRKTTDGDILDLRKDGSTVGSIGTFGSRINIGTGDVGILFDSTNDTFIPWNISTNASRSGAISFGDSTDRFKDLYLSGGVYLGGTGAANKLDDYEEGNWTPVIQGSTSQSGQTYSAQQGTYTKVGRQVTCRFRIILTAEGTFTGTYLLLAGFPFAMATIPSAANGGTLYFTDLGVNVYYVALQMKEGDVKAYLWAKKTLSASREYLANTDLTNTTAFSGTFTYFTA